jgi:hypothetical protein
MIKKLAILVLMFLPLEAFSSIEKIEMTSNDINTITIAWQNESNSKLIIVAGEKGQKLVPPSGSKKYKANPDLNMLDNKSITGENSYVVYNNDKEDDQLTVSNLSPETEYAFAFFTYNSKTKKYSKTIEKTFATLALEPTGSAGDIAFKLPRKKDKIDIIYKRGNGSYSVVLCSEEGNPVYPEDGDDIQENSEYGNKESRIGVSDTYVVYKGKKNDIRVEGLKAGTEYIFAVLEANGKGKSVNYLYPDDANNPRATVTALPPPVALPATEISKEHFIANWKTNTKYTKYYEIDVARDKNFTNIVPGFDGLDVGDYDNWLIYNLESDTEYYYRVRAVTKYGPTENSNVISVKTK